MKGFVCFQAAMHSVKNWEIQGFSRNSGNNIKSRESQVYEEVIISYLNSSVSSTRLSSFEKQLI